MPKWIPCGDGFIEADVIRWKEAVWRRPERKRRRAVRLGDGLVAAEVIRDEEGWVALLIRGYRLLQRRHVTSVIGLPRLRLHMSLSGCGR
jgi:hypothetical protein